SAGTLTVQSGGSVNVSGDVAIARTSGTSSLSMTGGSVIASGAMYVGGSSTAAGGTGTLSVGNGSVSVASLRQWNGSSINVNAGAGTMALGGANGYIGVTDIEAGAIKLTAADAVTSTSALTVATGATFDLNGLNDSVGSLNGAGSILLGSASNTLTIGGNG